MDRLKVVIAPEQETTPLLVMWGQTEVLRARLGAPSQVHRQAAPLLLEGLALWHQRPLSVVLSVASLGDGSPLLHSLSDGFGSGADTLAYRVRVVPRDRCLGKRLGALGNFRALRKLSQVDVP